MGKITDHLARIRTRKLDRMQRKIDKSTLGDVNFKYETDAEGNVLTEGEDGYGLPIFADELQFTCKNRAALYEYYLFVKDVIDQNLVPPTEWDYVFNLLEQLAVMYDAKSHIIKLRVNYFTGLWHCLNSARKFNIYKEGSKQNKDLEIMTMRLAVFLDMFHESRRKEMVATVKPGDLLKLPINRRSFAEVAGKNQPKQITGSKE